MSHCEDIINKYKESLDVDFLGTTYAITPKTPDHNWYCLWSQDEEPTKEQEREKIIVRLSEINRRLPIQQISYLIKTTEVNVTRGSARYVYHAVLNFKK